MRPSTNYSATNTTSNPGANARPNAVANINSNSSSVSRAHWIAVASANAISRAFSKTNVAAIVASDFSSVISTIPDADQSAFIASNVPANYVAYGDALDLAHIRTNKRSDAGAYAFTHAVGPCCDKASG